MPAKKIEKAILTYDENGNIKSAEPMQEYIKVPKRHFPKGSFIVSTLEFYNFLADCDYNALTMKVLCSLVTRIDFNNRIRTFRQTELADKHGTSQANISRSLKKLQEDNIIELRDHDYYFSENFIRFAGDYKKKAKVSANGMNEIQDSEYVNSEF